MGLNEGSHYDSDDALYAQMAREMWSAGDWVDNRWSNTVLFEKPPLLLWSLAIAGHLGDWSEGALRFPLVCFAALGIWSLFGVYRRLRVPAAGAISLCLLVLTSFYFVMMTRRLMMDLPLVACALFALHSTLARRFVWAGVGAGLSILAKGVAAGPLVLAVLLVALVGSRTTRETKFSDIAVAIGAAVLVAAPWHIAATLRHGMEFWEVYVGHHVGVRATQAVVPGISLTDMMMLVLRDWLLVLGAIVAVIRGVAARASKRNVSPLLLVGLAWSCFALLPVLFSTTRLPHYAFPFVIGLALLSPAAISSSRWKHRYAPSISGALVVLVFMVSPARLALWLNADLAPAQKAIGGLLSAHASDDDVVAAFNTTTAALTFYSGGKRIEIFAADPTFLAVQRTVLMNEMVGQIRDIGDQSISTEPTHKRFVIARQVDRDEVVSRFLKGEPARTVSVVDAMNLVLVNDGGLGEPVR